MTYSPQARRNLTKTIRKLEEALKTQAFYQRALSIAVADFYNDTITAGAFVDKMIYLIEEQFRRAWNEGARSVGYDPEDQTDDDRLVLMQRVEDEKEFVLDFAGGIEQARLEGKPVKPLLDRVSMWANRYNEIRDWARAYFGGLARLKWVLGPTEHCADCLRLAGTVATARQWNEARDRGIYPKSQRLQCHGYRCQCSLVPTKENLTDGGIPDIL